MVQEVRRIMLTPDELIAAFESHRRVTPDFLPGGKVIDCIAMDDNRIRVTLQTTDDTRADFIVKSTEAVMPLTRFCLENNIMLPRHGQKSLFVKDGVASLYVVLNLITDVAEHLPVQSIGRSHSFSPGDIVKGFANATG